MAVSTVNYRVKKPQAVVINGVNAGGSMQARISSGYDVIYKSAPDGLGGPPLKDREVQFCRGTIVTQDWVEAVNLLNGTVGTLVFYERKSAIAEATGYIKHTITAPVIHRFTLSLTKGGYATCSFDFECMAADPAKTMADMWAMTDSIAAPTYVSAARGGFRVVTTLHGAAPVYHVTAFTFSLAMKLTKACNDGDIGYTCIDVEMDNIDCTGSITFQDGKITTAQLTAQALMAAAAASLVLTVKQGQAAVNEIITIAKCEFNTIDNASDAAADFTEYTANFDVVNNATTPLSLAGANKIITIAAAA